MKKIKDRITNTICKKRSIRHSAFSIKKSFLGIACLLGFLYSKNTNAQQQQITLNDAIEMALKSNNQIRGEKLKTEYAKSLIDAGVDIPKTSFTGEFGKVNSAYDDSKFGISQKIAFPTVYSRQKRFLKENYQASLLHFSLKEFEIKKMITQVFYNYLYLNEKKKLLEKAFTLYEAFYQKANLRLQKGESNILEKITAETQKSNITIQLKLVTQELEATALEFKYILNQNSPFLPTAAAIKFSIETERDTENNPFLKIAEHQIKLASIESKLERSKLLPDLSFSYFNNSFIGNGPDNKTYVAKDRFNSVQIGLDIPVFFGSQKAKIKTAKIKENEAQVIYELQAKNLDLEAKKLLASYQNSLEALNYFEKVGLENAKLITETANKQFISGEINYLDFIALSNQSITLENNYLEALKSLNDCAIQLQYLTLK